MEVVKKEVPQWLIDAQTKVLERKTEKAKEKYKQYSEEAIECLKNEMLRIDIAYSIAEDYTGAISLCSLDDYKDELEFENAINNYFLLFLRVTDLERTSGMVDEKSIGLVSK